MTLMIIISWCWLCGCSVDREKFIRSIPPCRCKQPGHTTLPMTVRCSARRWKGRRWSVWLHQICYLSYEHENTMQEIIRVVCVLFVSLRTVFLYYFSVFLLSFCFFYFIFSFFSSSFSCKTHERTFKFSHCIINLSSSLPSSSFSSPSHIHYQVF